MKQVLQQVRNGALEVAEVPPPSAKAGGILVRNAASLISAGTEKMIIEFAQRSLIGKARSRPDLVRQVLTKVRNEGFSSTLASVLSRLDQPIPLGYSCAGVVESVGYGLAEFSVGDRVACAGMGYASHAEMVFVPKNLAVAVPAGVSMEDAAYVTLGAISLQGVRVLDSRIGDRVAVIGLGLLGQLTVQLLCAAGCRVFGIDVDDSRVQQAVALGAEEALARHGDVTRAISLWTGSAGVDGVVITAATEMNDPIELAGEICRDRGRVSVVGAVGMNIPRKPYYEKELEVRLSRSYGPGRYDPSYEQKGNDYPIGYVRWTERRNMEEFLRLVALGKVTPSALTSHRFPIGQALEGYDIVTGKAGARFAGVVLTYDDKITQDSTVRLRPSGARAGYLGVGFLGAGSFAQSILLPRFQRSGDIRLIGIATSSGVSAKTAGSRFGFEYATSDVERVIADDSISAIVIATRHSSHASLAVRAMKAGKAVFVEKPLALDQESLEAVLAAQRETGAVLATGFNRRFSPMVVALRASFSNAGPMAMTYRVNAGSVPATSWINDEKEGGGRIIGEVGHFIDTLQFLSGENPTEVSAFALSSQFGLHDNVAVTLRLERGSVATLAYYTHGDKAFPKERIEAFAGGTAAALDDFRVLQIARAGRITLQKSKSQQKGFDEEVAAFLSAVRGTSPVPIPLRSIAATSRATFGILQSLRSGGPIELSSAL